MKKFLIPIIILLLITPVLANCKTDADCPKVRCPGAESKCINGECVIPRCSAQETLLSTGLEELKNQYNQNIDNIPWIVKSIIGDERVNVYLTNHQELIIGTITENAIIISIQEGEIDNPTLNIYISENTIQRLQDNVITIQQALDTKEIKIESQRIRTSIKMWLADKALTVISWFT